MYPEKITKDEVNELPLIKYEGPIALIDKEEDYKKALSELRKATVIGFDTETRPAFKKGQSFDVALIQLAIPDIVFLIRLNLIGLRDGLVGIFENPDIRKVGISIRDDVIDLQKMNGFDPQNVFEINDATANIGIINQGVRNLSGIILESRISKSQQTSNWENPVLHPKQQVYAATDAWVCLEIYQKLLRQGFIED
ncbi:MAG: 3'-5' exonuclease [Cyclobacteriaceae bacterium]